MYGRNGALLLGCVVAVSCASTPKELPAQLSTEVIESQQTYSKEYIIAPGDLLQVTVYRYPEFSEEVAVRSDGYISVPVLDDVAAAGKSVPDLDRDLTTLLSKRITDPEVTVIVRNPQEPTVYVVGEVGSVQAVPLRQARTAAQAIARASGMKQTATHKRLALIRLNPDGRLAANIIDNPDSGAAAFYMALQNVVLQPDDILVIPESGRSQFVRFINDFITTPLQGVNTVLTPYFQFRLINEVSNNG